LLDNRIGLWYNLSNVAGNDTGIVTAKPREPKQDHSMSPTRATVTIRDVAEAAGVSVSTVSRVLNDKDDVAPGTYQKVQEVIDALGYTSSLAARGMRSHRMNVIGLVTPDVGDPFSIQVMKGVSRAIAELDYDLIVYTGGEFQRETSADRERRFVSLVGSGITDGIIVVTPATTSFPTASPVVVVDPNVENHDCPAVIATNRDGALERGRCAVGLTILQRYPVSNRSFHQEGGVPAQTYLFSLEIPAPSLKKVSPNPMFTAPLCPPGGRDEKDSQSDKT
jgi:transcriptional regulator with XRE-family HTH domain